MLLTLKEMGFKIELIFLLERGNEAVIELDKDIGLKKVMTAGRMWEFFVER
jgi:hypothetical protein